jgi:hypothetical protein
MSPLKHWNELSAFPDIALGRFLTAIAASIGGLLKLDLEEGFSRDASEACP